MLKDNMAHKPTGGQAISDMEFTERLQDFHRALSGVDWKRDLPECVFIRDFKNLPQSAPFDIDLMAPEKSFDDLASTFSSLAEKSQLLCLSRTSHTGLYILLFDVNGEEGRRGWSYYEVRKELPLTGGDKIIAADIEIISESGIPVPSKQWQFLLFLHQGLRKGKVEKFLESLQSMLDADSGVVALCEVYLGLSRNDICSILANPEKTVEWRVKTGIRYAVGKKKPVRSRLSELKQKLARKFYFWHTKGPVFFTLHGPDGVGKTTITEEIASILGGFPFSHEVFHHITGWKRNRYPPNTQTKEAKGVHASTEDRVPLWRKILRVVYRNLPPVLQGVWIYSSNYIKYSSNLNRHILDRFDDSKVMICDRYIYDLWAKEQVAPGYLRILHPLHYLHCRTLRFPKLAFVINDAPEEIYKRKQELTIEQIAIYQDVMDKTLKGLGVPMMKVSVSGRKPPEIAREITFELIKAAGPVIFNLIREEQAKKAREAVRGNS